MRLALASSAHRGSSSTPTALRPRVAASTRVVPIPHMGSATSPPGGGSTRRPAAGPAQAASCPDASGRTAGSGRCAGTGRWSGRTARQPAAPPLMRRIWDPRQGGWSGACRGRSASGVAPGAFLHRVNPCAVTPDGTASHRQHQRSHTEPMSALGVDAVTCRNRNRRGRSISWRACPDCRVPYGAGGSTADVSFVSAVARLEAEPIRGSRRSPAGSSTGIGIEAPVQLRTPRVATAGRDPPGGLVR